MKNRKDIIQTASESAILQAQPMPGVPFIEICGSRRVLIENHQGIIAYGPCEILVKVRYGLIYISGENLKLCKMCREQLVIVGQISGVNLQRGK